MSDINESVIIHLIVVGFHHKKGCLVEYCYPPIDYGNCDQNSIDSNECDLNKSNKSVDNIESDSDLKGDEKVAQNVVNSSQTSNILLPLIWKTLPSLALPDGSHNHKRDTIYFHLPDVKDHNITIYGVSCYRQINADELIAKTSDITRGTVQKSVVVLSRLPLYGLIQAKLEMITHAYFRELDFSKVSLLEETFHNLNSQLHYGLIKSSELYVGLSPKQLVINFSHKILLLFKLLLLERKILFYKTPVRDLCIAILSLCSLIPGMIEKGLNHSSVSVHPKHNRQFSSEIELSPGLDTDEFFVLTTDHDRSDNSVNEMDDKLSFDNNDDSDDDLLKEIDEVLSERSSVSSNKTSPVKESSNSIFYDKPEPKPERIDKIEDNVRDSMETPPILKLGLDECGFPLEVFNCGSYCLPYLSLTYLDVLTDVRVRSCCVGATNFLFKQKKDIFDVIVEIDSGKVDITDIELRKQLNLSTEDLRFADYLVKTVISESDNEVKDIFLDGTGWEGSDEWIRYQFKVYLLHMLRSSELDETSRDYISFNSNFMTAWRSTHNYKIWSSVSHPGVFEVSSGHPFGGQLSVNDMKLRLSHIFYSKTDQNKKLNQTVSRTSKAVSGAITTAKSSISNWWTNWGKNEDKTQPKTNKRAEEETVL